MHGITNSYTIEASFGGSSLGSRKNTHFSTAVSIFFLFFKMIFLQMKVYFYWENSKKIPFPIEKKNYPVYEVDLFLLHHYIQLAMNIEQQISVFEKRAEWKDNPQKYRTSYQIQKTNNHKSNKEKQKYPPGIINRPVTVGSVGFLFSMVFSRRFLFFQGV